MLKFKIPLGFVSLCLLGIAAFPADIQLQNGVVVEGTVSAAPLGGVTLSQTQYFISIPSDATHLSIQLNPILNPLSDLDLQLRYGQRVGVSGSTILSDTFSETVDSGLEFLLLSKESNPLLQSGTYYIGITNWENESIQFNLLATYDTAVEEPTMTPTPTLPGSPTNTPSPTQTPTMTSTRTPTPTPTLTNTQSGNNPTPTETLSLGKRADLDQDGIIGSSDLLLMQSLWMQPSGN